MKAAGPNIGMAAGKLATSLPAGGRIRANSSTMTKVALQEIAHARNEKAKAAAQVRWECRKSNKATTLMVVLPVIGIVCLVVGALCSHVGSRCLGLSKAQGTRGSAAISVN